MANLAMALEEIIQQDRKTKAGGSPRRFRRQGPTGGRPAGGGPASGAARFSQRGFVSGDVPAGRWKHDKFFETYGGGGKVKKQVVGRGQLGKRLSGTGTSMGGGRATGGIAARLARKAVGGGQSGIVKMQISNLPKTVITSDLEELFQEFNCYGVTVHYDETGTHLGTADMFTDQQSANQILREFKDIAVDGKQIQFCIVSEAGAAVAPIVGKSNIRDRLRRIGGTSGGGGVQKKRTLVMKKRVSGGGKVGAARAGAASRRKARGGASTSAAAAVKSKAKTAEDLDKELEAYMQKK